MPPAFAGAGFDDAALDCDVPRDIAVGMFGPLVGPGIAGIGEDRLLPPVQHRRHLVDVSLVGGRAGERVHHPRGNIDADMRLHPKVPLVGLLGLMHLRIAGFALVLVEGEGR